MDRKVKLQVYLGGCMLAAIASRMHGIIITGLGKVCVIDRCTCMCECILAMILRLKMI